jgi:hypothetical protein
MYIKKFKLFESISSYEVPKNVKDRLSDDGYGNYIFYHYSREERSEIKPGTGQNTLKTSREEIASLSSIGGLAMYYTLEGQKEYGMGSWKHTVKIPYNKVYYFNEDALNFYDIAYERFRKIYDGNDRPKLAFNPNYQIAWITKVANENGFKMIVAEWDKKLRAQTTLTLIPYSTENQSKYIF